VTSVDVADEWGIPQPPERCVDVDAIFKAIEKALATLWSPQNRSIIQLMPPRISLMSYEEVVDYLRYHLEHLRPSVEVMASVYTDFQSTLDRYLTARKCLNEMVDPRITMAIRTIIDNLKLACS